MAILTRLVAALLCLAGAAFAEGPLPLRTTPLLTPDDVAVAGLAPEVAARLAIDDRGRVTQVDVVSIRPPSAHDDLFRDAVIDTFSTWRFAPARENGVAKASELDWRVKFVPRSPLAARPLEILPTLPGVDAELRRAAVLALPLESRRTLLEGELRDAIGHLDLRRTREVQAPRFTVRSDADDERAASSIATNLEVTFNLLASELLPGIQLQAEPLKLQVVVYRTAAQYAAFVSGNPWLEGSAGFYSPTGLIALHLEAPTSDSILGTLLHEATHAFLDRHVVRPGVALPRWLGEGFAEYVGNSAIEKGKLKPGKTLKRKMAFAGPYLQAYQTDAGAQIDAARAALRKGQGIALAEMLAASLETFYGEKRSLFYASSWLAVHYLREGGDDGRTERFRRLLLYLAEGYPAEAAFEATYGPLATADRSFRDYVKGL